MQHTDSDHRIYFIRKTIREKYNLEILRIEPVEPFGPGRNDSSPNNFVYRVNILHIPNLSLEPGSPLPMAPAQPGTVPIPDSAVYLIMRLSNDAKGYSHQIRVRNEVAAMSIARTIFEPRKIIPDVYGWESAVENEENQGWILMEYMRGTSLAMKFDEMTTYFKIKAMREFAHIVLALQQYNKLPESIQGFGGMDFDPDGNIIIGPLTLLPCGPFETYPEMLKGMLRKRLEAADQSPTIRGWRDTSKDTRAKLEKFIADDVDRMLQSMKIEKILIHGDLTFSNILFDIENYQITAIVDFDYARIGSVADDMLCSYDRRFAKLPTAYETDPELILFRDALLHGFPSPMLPSSGKIKWDTAKLWDGLLAEVGAQRPSTLEGIEQVSCLYCLMNMICPKGLRNEAIMNQVHREEKERRKETLEAWIHLLLEQNQASPNSAGITSPCRCCSMV